VEVEKLKPDTASDGEIAYEAAGPFELVIA
jgi:hypothetical protein